MNLTEQDEQDIRAFVAREYLWLYGDDANLVDQKVWIDARIIQLKASVQIEASELDRIRRVVSNQRAQFRPIMTAGDKLCVALVAVAQGNPAAASAIASWKDAIELTFG